MRTAAAIGRGEAWRCWDRTTNVRGINNKEQLIQILKTDSHRRDRAVIALSRIGENALPDLFEVLQDKRVDFWARKAAFEAIGAIYNFVELDLSCTSDAKFRH